MVPNQKKAYIYGCATVLMWSTVAAAFKMGLQHMAPVQLVFVSTIVSLLFLLCLLAFQKRLGELRQVGRRDVLLCAFLGFLNPFLYYLGIFEVYNVLPAQIAQPVNYTWSIMLALLSVPFLGHSMRRLEWVAITVSYLGVVVIASRGELDGLAHSNWYGLSLALGSTMLWSLYWIFNTKSRLEPVLGLTLCFAFGLPWIIVTSIVLLGWEGFAIPITAIPYGIYVGLFEMGLSFVFWLLALRYTTSLGRISNLIFFSPFLSLILINVVVGETILPSTLLGLVCIVAGNLLQQYATRRA
ncbi:MAG: DMT family transporter [Pseudomonadota bacterium]